MAIQVINNAFFQFGGVDLSDHVKSVSIEYNCATQEATAMGDLFTVNLAGLKSWSVSVEFNQDYATGKVDATLFSAMGASTAVVIRPDTGVVGAANPQFAGNVRLSSYSPISGSAGDALTTSPSFTGNGALNRTVE